MNTEFPRFYNDKGYKRKKLLENIYEKKLKNFMLTSNSVTLIK